MTSLPAGSARRCQSFLNPYHSAQYFSPEIQQEVGALGIGGTESFGAVYLAGRAAAFGRVGPGVVTASFFSFSHELVSRHLPAVWDIASPEDVLAARLRAADAQLRRLLGEETVASAEMAEAAELALRATEACDRSMRTLYAAHADLPVPDAPHLALWHATTLLREYRGDGHLMVLVQAGIDPIEAVLTHSATGKGMSHKWLLRTRGWSEDDLAAGRERLLDRGLLNTDGTLTQAGVDLREELEDATDRLDRAPYEHLGAAGVARLTELAQGYTTTLVEGGAFPSDLRG